VSSAGGSGAVCFSVVSRFAIAPSKTHDTERTLLRMLILCVSDRTRRSPTRTSSCGREVEAAEQREQLVALIQTRVGMINDSAASLKMSEVRATLDQTYFAWSGPTAVGSAAYFRVTRPSLFIEYSPQSMGGSATNHTHAMYREFGNDYGASL
jgi:hypothetical protein